MNTKMNASKRHKRYPALTEKEMLDNPALYLELNEDELAKIICIDFDYLEYWRMEGKWSQDKAKILIEKLKSKLK